MKVTEVNYRIRLDEINHRISVITKELKCLTNERREIICKLTMKRHCKERKLEAAVLRSEPRATCVLCNTNINDEVNFGEKFSLGDLTFHYLCVSLSSHVKLRCEEGVQGLVHQDLVQMLKQSSRVRCGYCQASGASIHCHIPTCNMAFHLPCGLLSNCLCSSNVSYCASHRSHNIDAGCTEPCEEPQVKASYTMAQLPPPAACESNVTQEFIHSEHSYCKAEALNCFMSNERTETVLVKCESNPVPTQPLLSSTISDLCQVDVTEIKRDFDVSAAQSGVSEEEKLPPVSSIDDSTPAPANTLHFTDPDTIDIKHEYRDLITAQILLPEAETAICYSNNVSSDSDSESHTHGFRRNPSSSIVNARSALSCSVSSVPQKLSLTETVVPMCERQPVSTQSSLSATISDLYQENVPRIKCEFDDFAAQSGVSEEDQLPPVGSIDDCTSAPANTPHSTDTDRIDVKHEYRDFITSQVLSPETVIATCYSINVCTDSVSESQVQGFPEKPSSHGNTPHPSGTTSPESDIRHELRDLITSQIVLPEAQTAPCYSNNSFSESHTHDFTRKPSIVNVQSEELDIILDDASTADYLHPLVCEEEPVPINQNTVALSSAEGKPSSDSAFCNGDSGSSSGVSSIPASAVSEYIEICLIYPPSNNLNYPPPTVSNSLPLTNHKYNLRVHKIPEHKKLKKRTRRKPVSNRMTLHQCPVCLETFADISKLKAHQEIPEGAMQLKCQYKGFREKPRKCSFKGCRSTFSNPKNLENHERKHTKDKLYKCSYEGCHSAFSHPTNLEKHERRHTEDKLYKCSYEGCHSAFAKSKTLQIHQRTHTGYKPYKCKYEGCNSSFLLQSKLKIHERKHTGDKPYKCSYEGCSSVFSSPSGFCRHKTIHTGIKPYKCGYKDCGSAFRLRAHLKVHERIHTGEKPYKCRYDGCSSAFPQQNSLQIHERKHGGVKLNKCKYEGCSSSFHLKQTLRNHELTHRRETMQM